MADPKWLRMSLQKSLVDTAKAYKHVRYDMTRITFDGLVKNAMSQLDRGDEFSAKSALFQARKIALKDRPRRVPRKIHRVKIVKF